MSPDAAASEFSIETRDLNLWYGDFQALKNITVNIKHGIITALIGPSGCGKTTFLRCSNRLNERYGGVRTTGEIRILAQKHLRSGREPVRAAQGGRAWCSSGQIRCRFRSTTT